MNAIKTHELCGQRRILALIIVACVNWSQFAEAQGPALPDAVLKKVKNATVYLRVKLESGADSEGTGWFVEPGLIVTNAHVLGLIGTGSSKPQRMEAVINSGEAGSQTLIARFAGGDLEADLALLRVAAANLPEPLTLGATSELLETQEVLVFGFPFGKQLGKAITVTKSSITSLRKDDGGLNEIQVNGGMHPGNSGGPVVNQKGEAVGVAVSGILGTAINMAIPVGKVSRLLNGKFTAVLPQMAIIENDQMKIPVRLVINDPLNRMKTVQVEHWLGSIGKTNQRPRSMTLPQPVEGDGDVQACDVKYEGKAVTVVEVPVPSLTDDKQCYWMRATAVDGTGTKLWSTAFGNLRPLPVERREVTLKFQPATGPSAPMQLTNDSTFRVQIGTTKETRSMLVKVVSNPVFMAPNEDGDIASKLRFSSVTLGMRVNGEPVNVKDKWAPLSQGFLKTTSTLQYADDGSVITSQSDLGKIEPDMKKTMAAINDHLLQSMELLSVSLPDGTIRPLEKIRSQRTLSIGLPGMFVPAQADLKYQYLGVRTAQGSRQTAVFDVTGKLRPRRGDDGKIGGTITGAVDVFTDTGEVSSGSTVVTADMEFMDAVPFRLLGSLVIDFRRSQPAALKPKTTEEKKPGTE